MNIVEALLLAMERGWSPGVWVDHVDEGQPEVEHPFDYLTEAEVESIVPGEDTYVVALRLSRS